MLHIFDDLIKCTSRDMVSVYSTFYCPLGDGHFDGNFTTGGGAGLSPEINDWYENV